MCACVLVRYVIALKHNICVLYICISSLTAHRTIGAFTGSATNRNHTNEMHEIRAYLVQVHVHTNISLHTPSH